MTLTPLASAIRALSLFAFTLAATAHAAQPALVLKPAQVKALGVQVQAVNTAGQSMARYPATVVVPSNQQRVVAAPLQGLVEMVQASAGDVVRQGQVLATLRSSQAQELAREVLTSHSQASLAQAAATRDEQLFKEGLIPLSRLEASRAQARQAQAMQQERQRALSQAGASSDGSSITLRAPISGVVLARPVVVGQRMDQSAPLFHIAALSPLWLEMQVPAGEAASVQMGDAVRVVGNEATGRVIAIGHAVDASSQSVLVRAEVKQVPNNLRVGQAVEAQLERAVTGLAQLPSAAVLNEAGQYMVLIETREGQYQSAQVQPVSSAGNTTAVRGLPPGSKVVVQGTAALKSLLATAHP
jgi:cobalt-zinc-cadmium efflux system membrane fusion protein